MGAETLRERHGCYWVRVDGDATVKGEHIYNDETDEDAKPGFRAMCSGVGDDHHEHANAAHRRAARQHRLGAKLSDQEEGEISTGETEALHNDGVLKSISYTGLLRVKVS